jgi:hypothetical protein
MMADHELDLIKEAYQRDPKKYGNLHTKMKNAEVARIRSGV